MNWLLLAGGTAFFWGSSTVLAKVATIRLSPKRMLMTYGITSFIFYWFIWRLLGSPFPEGNYLFPLLSEGCAAISFIFYYKALEKGPISLIAPLTSSGVILSVLIGVFVFHNSITHIQIGAISSIITGIILLTINEFRFNKGKWIIPALITTIGWGIWGGFSEIAVSIVKPFNLNLFFAGIALLIWIPYYFLTDIKEKRNKITQTIVESPRDYTFGIGSAIVCGIGSILFYIAVDLSYVSLVIPVASLHPLVAVIYDIFNHKAPKPHQWIGIILIISGLFFIQ